MTSEAPIVIEDYSAAWPARFESERTQLAPLLRAWLTGPIEHVGSTAVPGLAAKPVIDIMAGVSSLEASRPAIEALVPFGYQYFPYRPDEEHWFCKPSPAFRTHHLHLVPVGSRVWVECITFRDVLRERADLAAEYAALKQELAETYRLDREAYTAAKGPFVSRILKDAGL